MPKEDEKRINLRFDKEEENLVAQLQKKLSMPNETATVMQILRAASRKGTGELLIWVHDTDGVLTQPIRELCQTMMEQNEQIIRLLERGGHDT